MDIGSVDEFHHTLLLSFLQKKHIFLNRLLCVQRKYALDRFLIKPFKIDYFAL